jgi:hypothetical protein
VHPLPYRTPRKRRLPGRRRLRAAAWVLLTLALLSAAVTFWNVDSIIPLPIADPSTSWLQGQAQARCRFVVASAATCVLGVYGIVLLILSFGKPGDDDPA